MVSIFGYATGKTVHARRFSLRQRLIFHDFLPQRHFVSPHCFYRRSGIKKRPVVVVCDYRDADLLVAPVTSQAARSSRDVQIRYWQKAGLRLPSICRMEKLATIDKNVIVRVLGKLTPDDWQNAMSALQDFFIQIKVQQ